jgi:hypothetical protein
MTFLRSIKSARSFLLLLSCTLFFLGVKQVPAQEASSGISGTITDGSGALVAGARVVEKNTSTNVISTTKTNSSGYYDFPVLPAGEYVVSVTAPGFTPTRSSPFTIQTGQPARIDLPMKIGSVDVTVQVTSAATLMNTTTNELGVTMDPQEIDNLPVENRNLFDLIALQPGVNSSQSGDADSTGQNARGGFEVNGAPGLSNSILLDGVDATFGEDNGAGAGNQVAINTVGLGAIAEFRTSSSVPPVQYGRAAGGVLTITTKSGANKVHGQIFEYFRNDVLDANTWQNKRATPVVPVPKLRFNEFGANAGGPIRRDHSFLFLSYEGSRILQGHSTTSSSVPSPFLIWKMSTLYPNTPNYQMIVQELKKMPLPNSPAIPYDPANPTVNNGIRGTWTGNLNYNTIEDTGLGRVDTTLGAHHHLTVRTNVNNQSELEQQLRPDNQLIYPLRLYNSVVSDAWTISPNLVNEFRIGLNRNDLARHNSTYYTDPFRNYIVVTSQISTDSAESQLHFLTTTYSLVDNLTLIHGKHTITFGTDDRDLRSARYQDTNTTTTYANTTAMYANKPTSVAIYFGHSSHFVSWQWAFFAQDSFRATNRLTLNYGVRYENYTPLRGAFNIRNSDPFSALSANKWDPFFTEDRFNLAPRVGLVGDILGNQKLVFRAGFGLMFLPPQPFLLYNSAFLDPRLPSQATVNPSDVPGGNASILQYPLSKTTIEEWAADPSTLPVNPARFVSDYHHPDQYSINWNANLQYQARKDLFLSLTYTALRDQHSPSMTLPNQFAHGACPLTGTATSGGTCGPRPNPSFGAIDYNIYAGREYYDGLYGQVSYRRGPNRANFYYTYASGISYWASNNNIGTGQSDIQDLANPEASRGPSTGSSRNRIAASYTFTPPVPRFALAHAALRQTLGGWSLQSIFKYNSGTVRNVVTSYDLMRNGRTAGTRPDRVPGQSLYLKKILSNGTPQWLNPAAFDYKTPFAQQRYGTLGWNAVYGPVNFSWNASVIKSVRFYQDRELRLRVEAFNVLNHQNLGSPNLTVNNSDFAQITTRRSPRNLQLGAEMRF